MNKAVNKKNQGASGVLRIFISALLCVSLFATGLTAAPDCGPRCCCSVASKMQAQHPMPMKIQSMQGCCSGNAPMPCDIQNAQPHELPDAIFGGSNNSSVLNMDAYAAEISVELTTGSSAGACHSVSFHQQFRSPPLYLANLAILA